MKRVATLVPALLLFGGAVLAQQPCGMGAAPSAGMRGGMAGRTHRPMGQMDSSMMARMDSIDTQLDSLQRRMNQASGSRRVGAMADLLGALVNQHREMHRMMREEMNQTGMSGMSHPMGPGAMQHGAAAGPMPCGPGGGATTRDSLTSKPPRRR